MRQTSQCTRSQKPSALGPDDCERDRVVLKIPQTVWRGAMKYHLTPEEQEIEKNAHQLRSERGETETC